MADLVLNHQPDDDSQSVRLTPLLGVVLIMTGLTLLPIGLFLCFTLLGMIGGIIFLGTGGFLIASGVTALRGHHEEQEDKPQP